MNKINVLDKSISELIAAGEVVERPSSVVKELVENSIDANASQITVEIKSGGIRFIRVSDNGCGINSNDLPIAFIRHATSKIQRIDDLYNINSLGFRGEALPSIGSVSHMEIISKEKDEEFGGRLEINGGDIGSVELIGCPNGTTVIVKDLFYNVPARMKFLKKDSTEASSIFALIERLVLSHPEISFRFIKDGELKLVTPGNNDLIATIQSVYGDEFIKGLVSLKYTLNGISVTGFISKPECSRSSRSMQHVYINHRYVQSKTVQTAVEDAYHNQIMVGKFPSFIIHLIVPNNSIDVNVHPSKLEVKYSDESVVYDLIYSACKQTLEKLDSKVNWTDTAIGKTKLSYWEIANKSVEGVQQHFAENIKSPNPQLNVNNNYQEINHKQQIKVSNINKLKNDYSNCHMNNHLTIEEIDNTDNNPDFNQSITEKESLQEPLETKYIGELFSTYILAQYHNKLLLIDKHAAHERLNFNRLKEQQKEEGVPKQILLEAIRISISQEEFDCLNSHKNIIREIGFEFEVFGENEILIREIPAILDIENSKNAIIDIAQILSQHASDTLDNIYDDLYHSIACKASIKANSFTSEEEKIYIINMLQNNPDIRNCPHGRPVTISISQHDIEKMFGRIQ